MSEKLRVCFDIRVYISKIPISGAFGIRLSFCLIGLVAKNISRLWALTLSAELKRVRLKVAEGKDYVWGYSASDD
jgi:hypothetical protein